MVPTESLSAADFAALLVKRVPTARSVPDEHPADPEGELLLHVLMADLGRHAQSTFYRGDTVTTDALLAVVDDALTRGDDEVVNAVQVSFVENVGPWDPATRPCISTWPNALRNEARRQTELG